jgi:hypothetical protein
VPRPAEKPGSKSGESLMQRTKTKIAAPELYECQKPLPVYLSPQ